MTKRAVAPVGLNHLVLHVCNLEDSHAFWTDIVGLTLVGEFRKSAAFPNSPRMRFYSGDHGNGRMSHHDISLIEDTSLPPFDPSEPCAIGHIALALPDREAWLRQLAFLQTRGVRFERRVEHGMWHSVYIRDPNGYSIELMYELPREIWEGDIDAALQRQGARHVTEAQ
jgi:catechol 2,3-dioxygenase